MDEISGVLYEDKHVKLSRDGWLTIKMYYFPVGAGKTINPASVRAVYYVSARGMNLKMKSWGMAFSNIWWACDMKRHFYADSSSARAVVLDVDEKPMKGFSVEYFQEFMDLYKTFLDQNVVILDHLP